MKIVSKDSAFLSSVSHDKHLLKKVYLKKNEVPGILQWATSVLTPGSSITRHKHEDAVELFQILKGRMHASINGEEHLLSEGDLLVVEAADTHAFQNTSKEPCSFLYTLIKG